MYFYFFLIFLFSILYYRNYLIQIIYNLFFVYESYNIVNKIKNNKLLSEDIDNYKTSICNVGVFAIKLVQWGLNRFKLMSPEKKTELILNELNVFYENCPFHNDDYTKKLFKKTFNFEIKDKYLLTRIASGSVAQVYKLEDINTGNKYAMKIVHPDVKDQIYISKLFFKFLFWLNNKFYKLKISFDLSNFFSSIEDQINLCNEAKYIDYFYNRYEKNKYVVIPKLINYSSDIIIMTYEEGVFYDDLTISEYKKSKIISLLEIFLLNTMIIDKFIHADLHNGNWKVRKMEDSNDYQLVIYDFGLCLNINRFNIRQLYGSIINNNKEELVNIICEGIINRKDISYCKKIILDTVNNNIDLKYMDMDNIIENILKLCYKLDIVFDSDYLTFLLLTINFQSVSSDYSHSGGASADYKGNSKIQEGFVKKSMYPYIIDFCEHYKIFEDLYEYLKDFIIVNKSEGTLFDDIESRIKITRNIDLSDIEISSDSDSDSE